MTRATTDATRIVKIDIVPRIAMSSATTTNVYRRRSASLTIQMARGGDR